MPRKTRRNTRGAIVSAAWKLFYEQGYEFVVGSRMMKGALSVLFDEKYAALMPTLPEDMDALETLALLNRELFAMIDASIPLDLLARLLSTQLTVRGEKHLLDRDRLYFRLLREIVSRGQARGEIRADVSVSEITKAYAMMERALMYDWCLCGGSYNLSRYGAEMMGMFLRGYRK